MVVFLHTALFQSNHVKFSLINHIEKRRLPKVSTDRGCHVGYVEQVHTLLHRMTVYTFRSS